MLNQLRTLLNFIKVQFFWLVKLNNEYKIKLILGIGFIFLGFAGLLTYFVYMKYTCGIEPIFLDIDTNTYLGKVISSKLFRLTTHFFFNIFNLGPSYETLIGLIVITYFVIIILIILASYIKLILIPLSIVVTFVAANLFLILKKQYTVGNTIEIFNKFGIKLIKNTDLPKIISETDLVIEINNLVSMWNSRTKLNNQICDWSNIDNNVLLAKLVEQKYTDWKDVNTFITNYIKDLIIINDMDWSLYSSNVIESTTNSVGLIINKSLNLFSNNAGTILLIIISIGGMFYLYSLIGLVHNQVKEVANVQDKQIELTIEVNKKLTTVDNYIVVVDNNLNTVCTHTENLSRTTVNTVAELNTQISNLADGLEKQCSGSIQLIDDLMGIQNNNGNIPITLGQLLQELGKLDDKYSDLAEHLKEIDKFLKEIKK